MSTVLFSETFVEKIIAIIRLSPIAETQIGDPYHRLGHATQMIHGPKPSHLQQPQRKRRGPRIDA
jgi:hypothetical protein